MVRLSALWLILSRHTDIPAGRRDETSRRMQLFLRYIEEHFSDEISLASLAGAANVSPSECLRCFKMSMGNTPYRYLTEFRLARAAALLAGSDAPVARIAAETGFNHPSHFAKLFRESTGCSPREYRKMYMK